MYGKYQHYTIEDFLHDDDFIQFLIRPTAQLQSTWNGMLNEYPEKKEDFEKAINLVKNLQFEEHLPSATRAAAIWEKIKTQNPGYVQSRGRVIGMKGKWWSYAAAAVVITVIAGTFFFLNERFVTVKTQYGELKTIQLPDHSSVTLNANSSIKYKKTWNGKEPREVWASGEAFFNVRHIDQDENIQPAEKFVVHLSKLDVEVLGTSFNVNDRNDVIKVMLKTGKVKIAFTEVKKEPLIMKPGELVAYSSKEEEISKEQKKAEDVVAWTEKKWEFNTTPMHEVFQMLKDNYGYEIKVEDQSILNRTMSGSFQTSNEELLLRVIETTMNLSIEKNKDTLIIRNK